MVSWENAVQEEHCKCLCNQNNSGAWFAWHVLIVVEGMWHKAALQMCGLLDDERWISLHDTQLNFMSCCKIVGKQKSTWKPNLWQDVTCSEFLVWSSSS